MSLFTCSSTNTWYAVQASLKTILVSHIGRHEGRKFEMVSRVVGSVIKERFDLNLSPGSGKNLVSNISATFVLIKCLWIEVKAPVGFSLVHWWAREKWQYQEIDCKMIIHHGLLGRNYWTGRLHGASEGRTQEKVCVEIWLFATALTVASQTPLSMEFPRQEYCSGLPFPFPRDLSNPGIKHASLVSPALAVRFFTISATWETPIYIIKLFV